ncbi:xanthine dehydrogenase accessory protein XdhC [Halotalea alkalilenta]|uniref:Xanthine dehydrogenase accessory protein XdhC n=1 Tax=Halotalea alkalilenta TaxID=376489 RepID=A0A172YFK8_9GAMM|nr:xanthine dehydrogenase accessory protein XdhC [Halotalea alkalilenta]ANF58004.1 hypothetical protein A5892_11465 [Halotalea alkalilenta]
MSDTPLGWSDALAQLQRDGEPHVLVSLVACAGSTPREPGAKMVVALERHYDTLGGGRFEQQLIESARALLARGQPDIRLERFALGARAQQCCGGHLAALLECYPGAELRLALFGAGHVGIALERLVRELPWRLDWFDSRRAAREAASLDHGPRTRVHQSFDTEAAARLVPGSHCLVMTHDHLEDERLIEALLARDDLASIGLIGSKTKWSRFRHRLATRGFDDARLDQVRCPIGAACAGRKRPAEIALAVAAELLAMAPARPMQTRRGLDGASLELLEASPPPTDQDTDR